MVQSAEEVNNEVQEEVAKQEAEQPAEEAPKKRGRGGRRKGTDPVVAEVGYFDWFLYYFFLRLLPNLLH
jgi:hypothetical protein